MFLMACSSSLFSTENIPLAGRAAVYSRTSLTTKGHLGCSPRLAVMNKAIMNHLCAGFCADLCFQLLWVSTTEHDCWIL